MIYFIKEIDIDNQPNTYDMCKIGVSKDPFRRVSQLQTGNPNQLSIILILTPPKGMTSYQVENRLHKRFNRERENLEWFRLTPRLQKFIDSHKMGHGQYPVYKDQSINWGRLFLWTLIGSGLLCAASAAILSIINSV